MFSRKVALVSILSIILSCSTSEISVRKDAIRTIKTVAVLPFTVEGDISEKAAKESMEAFKSHMLKAGFALVERQAIDKILKEKELSMSGLTADRSMELGTLLSADGLLEGRITRYGSETIKDDIALSEYGPDAYKPENDSHDGTYFQKDGAWYRKTTLNVFTFQIFVRLISAKDGQIVLTLQNSMPTRRYEVSDSMSPKSMEDFSNMVLQQMGKDLKKAIEK
jgi:hypothetical protein